MDSTRRNQRIKWLTVAAAVGLLHWFFGNLYEAVVISPNWVVDSPAQLTRLNEFFVRTSPTVFFVPLTPLAAVFVWLATLLNREPGVGGNYRRASLFVTLALAVNTLIVATLITRLFGDDYLAHAAQLQTYATRWNVLNLLRMVLVATTVCYLFQAFRQLDRCS
jgi:hypothetical protein